MRKSYTDNILSYSNNKLIKVIVGQRRVGKSYVLRQIANQLMSNGVNPNNIFYFNKEFIDFDFVLHYSDLEEVVKKYKTQLNPEGKIYLLIDEIQNISEWERFVNSYSQDFTSEYELYISGSNSKMLSGELATLLSGRYVAFEVFPFSFREYLGITNQKLTKQSFVNYMESGGLPEFFSLSNEETKRHYTASVIDTVLLRDIIQHFSVKDPKLLEDVFVYLVNNASNLVSINKVVNFMETRGRKTTYDTVANYIGYIEDAFLMHKAERFDIKGKDTISGTSKYYANDLAFKNYLFSGFDYGIGYKLENLIYLELRRAGYEVYVGLIRNREVDFVAKKANDVLYVQCAYLIVDQHTVKREYASLEMIEDNYTKIVVSLDDVQLPQNKGIKHIQAWRLHEFLALERM
ncbi:ATP-binding protein [Galbibacter marinus]|nr:ATP-binding protein [Galbibacter marinus]